MARRAPSPLPGDRVPRVSVVVPCYNYARYLGDCVRSALDQRDVDVDVTIVDDASTDDSALVAGRLAEQDPRVRLVRHETNQGHLRTANEALGMATADLVVKLDADDLLTPGSLARGAALLLAHPEVGFVYGPAEDFAGPAPVVPDGEAERWTVWPGPVWLRRVLRRAHNVIAQPEVMMRTAALADVGGGYDLSLPWAEDYHLWLRLATAGSVGRVAGCVQGLYRVHPGSLQRSADDLHLSDLRARVDATRLFLSGAAGRLPRGYQQLAVASLARDTRRLLAARREDPSTPAATLRTYEQIAEQLEAEGGVRVVTGPLVWPGRLGRGSRRVFEAVRWRRWRATGV